jgi:uncharacterized protein YkwD
VKYSLALLFPVALLCAQPAITPENVVAAINSTRTRAHVPPLKVNLALAKAAQRKATDMAARGYFSHDTPDGRTPWDFMAQTGYTYSTAAENLAEGAADVAELKNLWMNSSGHKQNILSRKFTETGVGVGRTKDGFIVVQMFGHPLNSNSPR